MSFQLLLSCLLFISNQVMRIFPIPSYLTIDTQRRSLFPSASLLRYSINWWSIQWYLTAIPMKFYELDLDKSTLRGQKSIVHNQPWSTVTLLNFVFLMRINLESISRVLVTVMSQFSNLIFLYYFAIILLNSRPPSLWGLRLQVWIFFKKDSFPLIIKFTHKWAQDLTIYLKILCLLKVSLKLIHSYCV